MQETLYLCVQAFSFEKYPTNLKTRCCTLICSEVSQVHLPAAMLIIDGKNIEKKWFYVVVERFMI